MMLDACKQLAKNRSQCKRGKRNGNRRDNRPEQKGVPLPDPELASKNQRMFPRSAKQFVCREWHRRSMEDAARRMNKRNYQKKFERIDNVVANLRRSDIQPEDQGKRKAKNRRAADDRIDADEQPGSNTPGELLRCGAHAEQSKDWKGNAAIDPVVVNGRVTYGGIASIWFVRMHL
jgi:hypothetical protein